MAYYDFNECEVKVNKAISPYFKAFEELGISVDLVPDCDNPADDFVEMYYGDNLVGYITPEVDSHEEYDSDEPDDYETHTVWDFNYIDVRITIMINLDRDYKHFYPKENENDLSDAVKAAEDYIILKKNEQIKKREEKLNQDF